MERADTREAGEQLVAAVNRSQPLLPAEGEDDVDSCLHGNRFSVEEIRTVAPGAHSIASSLLQHYRTADHAKTLNGSLLGDDGLKNHGPLNSRSFGNSRIYRKYFVNHGRGRQIRNADRS